MTNLDQNTGPRARIRRARIAISLVFALHGVVAGSFATRIPWVRDHLDLSSTTLGLALVFPAVGAVVMMPLAGGIVHRFGGRAAVRTLMMLWCGSVALPALSPSLPVLCVALLLFGAAAGTADVAMNANGVAVESELGKSIMSGLHGLWSVGALTGSAAGALAAALDVDARVHLAVVALLMVVAAAGTGAYLLDTRAAPDDEPPPGFALPTRAALPVGLLGFCGIFAEGASADWSGVYLKDVAGASAGIAAASYTAFAFTMALTRLGGDMLIRRLGPVRTVRYSGAVAVLGGLLIIPARTPAPGIIGFALLGIGIAVVVPIAFTAAGRTGPNPSQSIAGVATITYTSVLLAPAAIGALASVTSLSASFAVVTALTAVLVVAAGAVRPAERAQETAVAAEPVESAR